MTGSFKTSGAVLSWQNPAFSSTVRLKIERKQVRSAYKAVKELSAASTSWTDATADVSDAYFYRVISLDSTNGATGQSGQIEVYYYADGRYDLLRFDQNSASLKLSEQVIFSFTVPKKGDTEILVLSADYSVVRKLPFDAASPAGTYHLQWDGKNEDGKKVSPGLYLICLRTGKQREIKKAVILP